MDTTYSIPQHQHDNVLFAPQEVLEIVVENIAEDQASLSACSLASRTLLSICRAQRFRHLVLSNPSPTSHIYPWEICSRYRELITAASDIVGYTRHLTLILEEPLVHDPSLNWILNAFKSLHSLRLLPGSNKHTIKWDGLSRELRRTVQAMIRTVPLHTLVIDSYEHFPLETLRGVSSLKYLSFPKTTWVSDPGSSIAFSSGTLARPTALKLLPSPMLRLSRRMEPHLEPPNQLFLLDDLVELEVMWSARMVQNLNGVLKPCLRTLQALGVEFPEEEILSELDLSRFIALRSFRAIVQVWGYVTYSRSMITGQAGQTSEEFDAVLASLKKINCRSSKLEEIHLNLLVCQREDVELFRWGELDETVACLHASHHIQQVKVELKPLIRQSPATLYQSYSGPKPLFEYVRSNLPLLDALGILSIDSQFIY